MVPGDSLMRLTTSWFWRPRRCTHWPARRGRKEKAPFWGSFSWPGGDTNLLQRTGQVSFIWASLGCLQNGFERSHRTEAGTYGTWPKYWILLNSAFIWAWITVTRGWHFTLSMEDCAFPARYQVYQPSSTGLWWAWDLSPPPSTRAFNEKKVTPLLRTLALEVGRLGSNLGSHTY